MNLLFTFLFLLTSILFGNNSPQEDIQGKWLMYKVIQNKQDVTSEHNPENERYVIFKADKTFESGGKPYGTNTGKFSFNLKDNTLFLDSDSGPEDDSYWKVSFKADTMHWQGYGSEWAKDFILIHLKEK